MSPVWKKGYATTLLHAMAQGGTDPRHQFARPEGFGDVVVGSKIAFCRER